MPFRGTLLLVASLLATASVTAAHSCDFYALGGTPCVAAHSTTRALYALYFGKLYQVTRGSDGATTDITPTFIGGVANAAAQDRFCSQTTCTITRIYDQSGEGNDLSIAPPGGNGYGPQPGGYDNPASAIGSPVKVFGQNAYGVFISPGTGYRNDATTGIATGDAPEGMYAVLDGTHYNDGCCFDYGNAETSNDDTGNGHMEAIYFGNNTFWSSGAGPGPWIMADLENGLFSGQQITKNVADPTITSRFLTAIVKGKPGHWAIRGGNANSGGLSTSYSGSRPAPGYNPMSKEGAIILGIGGDNSLGGQGTFYEGVMTKGYPSDLTENLVQANVLSAGYTALPLTSGPPVNVGSTITFQPTTTGYTNRLLAHSGQTVNTQIVTSTDTAAQWTVRTGLGNTNCVSFESVDTPGSFIRHYDFVLQLETNDGSKQFGEDSTFCPQIPISGKSGANSIRAWGYPTRFFRHYENVGYIASNGGPEAFDSQAGFNDDVTWIIKAL
ncbi:hypothetical protein LTR62_005426 [Meristemomyces frigidus]|uniref:Alpha-L-arabinofuranosidase n=1 Tax=Meristemomyces frigidus TaxID=1508187 RepID=A0AAN7TPU4_9PEZI|nr:hypothetical protein LTR62_005426 [Meristemomyces frigidus]